MRHFIQKFRFQDAINKSSKPRKRVLQICRDLHNCTIKPEVGHSVERGKEAGTRSKGQGRCGPPGLLTPGKDGAKFVGQDPERP